jgi:hypothetical protein
MPASYFDVKPMTGRPKFIVRHSTVADKKKVGQCFFANVNLLALSMVTMNSTQFWLNFLIRLILLFFVRGCMCENVY